MTIEVNSLREAKMLAQAMKDGAIPEEKREESMAALTEWNKGKARGKTLFGGTESFKQLGRTAVGLGDLAITGITSGAGEIAGGLRGAANLLLGQGVDVARQKVEGTSKALTVGPLTDAGQETIESIAPAFIKLERSVDRFAERKAMGNPEVATAIKSALLGGLEFIVPAKGTGRALDATGKIARRQKAVQKIADEQGIRLDLKNMGDDIVDAARRMSPEERAQNAPVLQVALQEAKKLRTAEKDAAFKTARETRTFVETRNVSDLGTGVTKNLLADGFDVQGMPKLQARLAELTEFRAQGPTTNFPAAARRLNELELIRRRTIRNKSADPAENLALIRTRKAIDDFLDNEFNSIAINAGKIPRGKGALFGDAAGVNAWNKARKINTRWRKHFKEDKVITQLIERNSTPEEYRQWLMGASAMNARREASLTIQRMKEVLGKNHPAVEGIRQDFIFELVEPLFDETPNFRRFISNYDKMVRRNPSLVKELDLSKSALQDLRDFAHVKRDLPPGGVIFDDLKDVMRGVSRLAVGHEIAKAGLRVQLTSRFLNYATGAGVVRPKEILGDVMGVKFGEVAIPKRSPLAVQFMAGAALTGLEDEVQ
jgi:hypothetical protein